MGVARPASVSFVAVDAVVALLMCLTTSHGLGTALVAKSLVCISEVLQVETLNSIPNDDLHVFFRDVNAVLVL